MFTKTRVATDARCGPETFDEQKRTVTNEGDPRPGVRGLGAATARRLAHLLAVTRAQASEDLRGSFVKWPDGFESATERDQEQLIAALLSYSGKQYLVPMQVEVLPFLCSFAHLMRATFGESIWVNVHVDRDCLPWIIDPGALEEALLRLAQNSSDAMPQGGRFDIDASMGRPGTFETIVRVTDTGRGMSAAEGHSAWIPFFTTKENASFHGLGLPAVQGFATQSEGRLSMTSFIGSGTSVVLTFPSWRP